MCAQPPGRCLSTPTPISPGCRPTSPSGMMPTPAPASEDSSASRPTLRPTGVPGPVPGQGEWELGEWRWGLAGGSGHKGQWSLPSSPYTEARQQEKLWKRDQSARYDIVSQVFCNFISFVIWCSTFKVKFSFSKYKFYGLLHFHLCKQRWRQQQAWFWNSAQESEAKVIILRKIVINRVRQQRVLGIVQALT